MGFNWVDFKKTWALFTPHIFAHSAARKRCLVTLALILIDIAAVGFIPFLSKSVIDSLSLNPTLSICFTVILLGFFWTLEKTLSYLQDLVFFPVVNNTIQALYRKVIHHIHHIPLSHYQTLSLPEIISAIKRIGLSARSFIKITFLMIIPTVLKLMIAAFVVLKLGFMGLVFLASCCLSLIIFYKGTQWYTRSREETWQVTDTVTMRMNDSLLNTKLARFNESYEMAEIDLLLNREAALWYQTNTRQQIIHMAIGIVFGVTMTLLLYQSVLAIQQNRLTIGDFVMIKAQLIAAFLPLKNLSLEFRQLMESLVDIKKIIRLLESPIEQSLSSPNHAPQNFIFKLSRSSKDIEVHALAFSHVKDKALFKNVSFQVKKGEKIAITGGSGCGKSTLAGLLAALYKPHQGSILIQGQDITSLSKKELGSLIHFVPQDHRLFNESLRYNLIYGCPSISEQTLQAVIEQTGLDELVSKLQQGLNSPVGEMGTRLSGGEKQRIALARALLLKPSILILDETTHSLTAEAESRILTALFNHIPTVILISHRGSTLNHVDRIVRLQKNGLLEIDNHSYLRDNISSNISELEL